MFGLCLGCQRVGETTVLEVFPFLEFFNLVVELETPVSEPGLYFVVVY